MSGKFKRLQKRSSSLCMLLAMAICLPGFATESSNEQTALHVLNRLGYGPRPGDVQRVMQIGAERYIEQQLNPASIPLPAALTQKLAHIEIEHDSAGATLQKFLAVRDQAKDETEAAKQQRRAVIGAITEQGAAARLLRALESPRQLEEIMVDFWFNHFNVFSGKSLDRALVASYEREAIRPYVFGHFRDLLGATAKHPAMLFYLDNWLSTAADFHAGGLRQKPGQGPKAKANGLNENYARELMELHTLGVDGGYSQQDVTELARMLTGWTFKPRELMRDGESFYFDAKRHDNGGKQWLGRRIEAQGQREGELALDVLAAHPATARHLSFELAQYFVQDQPPPALVERLAQRYLDTQGDMRAVLRTLFSSAEFLGSAHAKFKTPYQFVLSATRASGIDVANIRPLLGTLNQLGMPLYGCQTPDGYKNTEAAWLNPDALTRRISFATTLAAGRLPLTTLPDADEKLGQRALQQQANGAQRNNAPPAMPAIDAQQLLTTLGSSVSANSRNAISANPPALRAAMLLGSPDFMQH